jgi:hypothetical protein
VRTALPDLTFLYPGEMNYLLKMRGDLEFLKKTGGFRRVLNIGRKNVDPLFLLAARESKTGKVAIPLRPVLKARI